MGYVSTYTQTAGITTLSGGTLYVKDDIISGSGSGSGENSGGGTTETPTQDVIIQGGVLTGFGQIRGSVQNSGEVRPGLPVGVLDLRGNFTQLAAGTLNLDFQGLTAGTQYDQLDVTGNVTLGGAITASSTIYTSLNDSFEFIRNDLNDGVTGTFAGLAQGGVVTVNGQGYRVYYNTGTGNDVSLVHPQALLSIDRVKVTEGTGGTQNAVFTVTKDIVSPTQTVTVQYATVDGTAKANYDYVAQSGTVTFLPGQTTQTITIPLSTDSIPETTEKFRVLLSQPTNASIEHSLGTARIQDDDGGPGLRDNFGTDFWLTFPHGTNDSAPPAELSFNITSEENTTGVVSIPGLNFTHSFSITAGQVIRVAIPSDAETSTDANLITNKGIHITSDHEVAVYGFNHREISSDGYLGLPVDALDREYIVLGWQNVGTRATEMSIVATANNTQVTITPTVNIDPQYVYENEEYVTTIPGHPIGVPFTVTLHQGQVYQLRKYGQDFTGTIVTASQPVAVFVGHEGANIPNGYRTANHINEQLTPTSTWGKQFVTVPLANRINGDTFRIIASQDATVINVSDMTVVLDKGEMWQGPLEAATSIIANQPIMVMQFANGQSYSSPENEQGDPSMILVPPVDQFQDEYRLSSGMTRAVNGTNGVTYSEVFHTNFFNIVIPTAHANGVFLDGVQIPTSQFIPVPNTLFSYAQIAVTPGAHSLVGEVEFGVVAYGYKTRDGYGYTGGMEFARIASTDSLTVTPANSTAMINTAQTVSAFVADGQGQPLAGVLVHFEVSGANHAVGYAYTNSLGHATFSYVGSEVGTDSVFVSTESKSQTVTRNWIGVAPWIEVQSPSPGQRFQSGRKVLITGVAQAGTPSRPLAAVMINGTPVDAFDASGTFFTRVEIQPGVNHYTLEAIDVTGDSATTTLDLNGLIQATGRVDFSTLSDTTAIQGEYGVTSWNETNETLYADLAIRNAGSYALDAPLLVAVKNISSATVTVRDADGYTPDGLPYYDFSRLVTGSSLAVGAVSGARTVAFHNPDQAPFHYELVVIGQLNRAPEFVSAPRTEVEAGVGYQYAFEALDPDGNPVAYSLLAGPQGLSFASGTRTLTWTPGTSNVGNHTVILEASDGRGGRSRQQFTLSVLPDTGNRPPIFNSVPPVSGAVNSEYLYQAVAEDADGNTITYSLVSAPDDLAIVGIGPNAGRVTWEPGPDQVGLHSVTIQASDGQGGISQQTFTIQVQPAVGNSAPAIISSPVLTAMAGGSYLYDVTAIDADGDALTYSLDDDSLSRQMTIVAETGRIVWSVPSNLSGTYPVTVTVRDGQGWSSVQSYQLQILNVAPVTLSGTVFNDLNGNGTQDSGESVQSGWTVFLDGNANRRFDEGENSTVTDSAGHYTLTGVTPGNFTVAEVVPANWVVSNPVGAVRQGAASPGANVTGLNFGNVVRPATNQNPTFTSSPPSSVIEGEVYRYEPVVTDADNDLLTFSLPYKPEGMAIDSQTGVVTWLAAVGPLTETLATIRVDDGHGGISMQQLSIRVIPSENQGPEIDSTPVGPAIQNRPWTYQVQAHDSNGDALTYSLDADSVSRQMSISASGLVSWAPDTLGSYRVAVTVSDGRGGQITQSFTLPVVSGNSAPQFDNLPNQGAIVGEEFTFTFAVSDPDPNQTVTLSLDADSLARGVSLDTDNRTLRWTPAAVGEVIVNLTADDGVGGTRTATLTIPARAKVVASLPPEITSTPIGPVYVGQPWTYIVEATDADSLPSSLTYALLSPSGNSDVSFDPQTHVLEWQPTSTTPVTFTVRVSDGPDSYAEQTFTITPQAVRQGAVPVITSVPSGPAIVHQRYTYQVEAFDPNGDELHYSLATPVSGAELSPTGLLTFDPSAVGTVTFQVVVDDEIDGTQTQTITLDVVAPPNHAPRFTSAPTGPAQVGKTWTYQPTAADIDGHAVTFSSSYSGNEAVTIDGLGRVSWIPSSANAEITVTTTANDGHGGTATQTFTMTAIPRPNHAPQFSTTPVGPAVVGQTWTYRPAASDIDGDTVTISLQSGAVTFSNGLMTWQPTAAGEAITVTLNANDGQGGTATQTFTMQAVAPPVDPPTNDAPRFTSTPTGRIFVGQAWRYDSHAYDPDGDSLTYSLDSQSLNAGLEIESATGRVRWTPTSVGTRQVTITADDGNGGYATQQFTLNVDQINSAPVIRSQPQGPALVGQVWSYAVDVTDADGHEVTITVDADSYELGIRVDTSGRVYWTPSATGSYPVTVTADDHHGGITTQEFTLSVARVNRAPEFTSQPSGAAYVGTPWTYTFSAADPDGDQDLTYTLLSGAGQNVQFDNGTRTLTWTPSSIGTREFEIQVSDGNATSTQRFTITALATAPSNAPPVIRSNPSTRLRVDQLYSYDVDAFDPNGDDLTYSLVESPVGMVVSASGVVSWQPDAIGNFDVIVRVSDGVNPPVDQPFTIQVAAPVTLNHLPEITSQPSGHAIRNRPYQYQLTATDPDGHAIHWSLDVSTIPVDQRGNIQIDENTGLLTWTPPFAGTFEFVVIANDLHGGTDGQRVTLPVVRNEAPAFATLPVTQVNLGSSYTYDANANDPGDTLVYTLDAASLGRNMLIDPNTGVVTWGSPVLGNFPVTITVTDGELTATQTYELLVTDPAVNHAPTINSSLSGSVLVGRSLQHQVSASDVDGDTLSYTLTSAPAGMTIDSAGRIEWTPTSSQLGERTFTVQVSDGRSGGTVAQTYTLTVVGETTSTNGTTGSNGGGGSNSTNSAPQFTTNPKTNLVAGVAYVYDANASDADGDTLSFSLVDAPSGMTIDSATGIVRWTPQTANIGTHKMTVRVLDARGAGLDQTVTLTVRAANRAPEISSNPPTQAVVNKAYSYAIKATDPDGHKLTFSFGAGTNVASNEISINPSTGLVIWTPTTVGTRTIQINVVDELGLGVAQTFDVDVQATPPNRAPKIITMPNLTVEAGSTYVYDIDATDPDGTTPTFQLLDPTSLGQSGTFDPETGLLTWVVNSNQVNQLLSFEVAATDGALSHTLSFNVRVTPANEGPVVTGIPNQSIAAGAKLRYDVQATDANNDALTYTLDPASVDRGMKIDSVGRFEWSPTAAQISATPYNVTVSVSDGKLTTTKSFTVAVQADTADPEVTIAFDNDQPQIGDRLTIKVHSLDNVGVTSRTLILQSVTFAGTTTTLDEVITLDATHLGKLTLLAGHVGTLTFVATAKDAAGNTTTTTETITVSDPSDVDPATVQILSPTAGAKVTDVIAVRATIHDDQPGVQWWVRAVPNDGGEPRLIATGTGNVDNAVIASFDPTLLRNGSWTIEVTAKDSGNHETVETTVVEVEGALKLGNFTVSFQDMTIPVSGFPITITRTYDTLDADVQGDFGYGWKLDIANTKVKIVQPEGGDAGLFGYAPFRDGTRVIITLPDGTKEGFTFQPKQTVSGFIATPDYLPRFVADYGVKSELIVPQRYIRKLGDMYLDMESGRDYTPADPILGGAYTLKLRNGTELAINAETGELSTITDRNGNTLTFTGMGIEHSSGRSVQFERDYAGRITSIADNAGRKILYEYDGKGNLIAVTDRVGATTRFTYLDQASTESLPATEHYLDQIIDPLGRPAAKTEFGADGRIKKVTDAAGKTIEYLWNDVDTSGFPGSTMPNGSGAKVQKITDQLGNVSIIETDSRGNVTRLVDPLGMTTLRTYDAEDRQLTETMVVGQIDSVANGETNDVKNTSVYNAKGDLIESIDARGLVTRTTYNEYGSPTSATNPLGHTISNNFNSTTGLLDSTRDPIGNVTSFKHDDKAHLTSVKDDNGNTLLTNTTNGFGEVLTSTPALGRTTYFDYDINGNQVATWTFDGVGAAQTQLLSVTYYDEDNRVIGSKQAVLPSGQHITTNLATATIPVQYVTSSSSTEYNSAGQVEATVDTNGLRTEQTFDIRGLQIESRSQTRDTVGNIVWQVSRTVYDAAGRAIASTESYTEGTTAPVRGSRSTYDAVGRVTQSQQLTGIVIDLVGTGAAITSVLANSGTVLSSSSTHYDALGRADEATDMYGLRSQTLYSALGDVVSTRRETVNELGQKVWLASKTVYDNLGRVIFSTDQYLEGATTPIFGTETVYDSLGRSMSTIRWKDVIVNLSTLAGTNGSPDVSSTTLISRGTKQWQTETFYDSEGRAFQSKSATGQISTTLYDGLGRQSASLGHKQTLADAGLANHPLATASNPAEWVQLRSETVYDAQGRAYQQKTNVRQFTLADGSTFIDRTAAQTTTNEFDNRGQVVKTTFTDGSFVSMTYDDRGRKLTETNQVGQTRTFEYDAVGRLVSVTLPMLAGQSVAAKYLYGYDAEGRQTSLTDPLGRTTTWEFDAQGRQVGRTLPLGYGLDGVRSTGDDSPSSEAAWTERMEYDDLGRQKLAISFEGAVTEYVYDQYGRMSGQRFFASLAAYDNGAGVPTEVWTTTQDAFGRVLSSVRTSTTEGTKTTTYQYDDEGRTTEVASPEGTLSYTYDLYGRKTSTIVGTLASPQRVTSYTYDALGRLATVTEDLTPAVTTDATLNTAYSYELNGMLDKTVLPNGTFEDYVYDSLNRLDTLTQYGPDETPNDLSNNPKIAEYDYTVRDDGRRTGLLEKFFTSGGVVENSHTWSYDAMNRLTSETIDSSNNALDRTTNWTFDLTGNRLSQSVDVGNDNVLDEVVSYTYDANDRLTREQSDKTGTASDTTTFYGYTGTQQSAKSVYAGLLSSEPTGTSTQKAATSFAYDLQGRMSVVTVTTRDGAGVATRIERTSYDYNTMGIRVSSKHEIDANADNTFESSTTTEFLTDHSNFTGYAQTVRETTRDQNGQITKTVDYSFGTDEISQTTTNYDGSGNVISTQTLVFGHDGHGSVRVLTDLAGALTQFFVFDAYGQMLAIMNGVGSLVSGGNGTLADAAQSLTNMLYSGESLDANIGQQYLRARWYDSGTGRFNRLDPFFGNLRDPQSFHKYLYTQADPVNGTDPSGNETLSGQMATTSASSSLMQSVKNAAIYAAKQAGWTTLETGIEYLITQQIYSWFLPGEKDDTDWGRTWITNYVSNLITGKMKNEMVLQKFLLDTLIQTLSDASAGKFSWVGLGVRALVFAGSQGLQKAGQKLIKRFAEKRMVDLFESLNGVDVSRLTRRETGDFGERIARTLLGENGFTHIISLTNASNNGIDLIARSADGTLHFFEVKASRIGVIPNLSPRQVDPRWFVNDILNQAADGTGRYSGLDAATRAIADTLRDEFQNNIRISFLAVGVDLLNKIIRVSPWG